MPFRHLFRLVERKLAELPPFGSSQQGVRTCAEVILREVSGPLSLLGARIYLREGPRYVLEATVGDVKKIEPGFAIPESYPPIEHTLENGVSVMDAGSPGVDPRLEARLGVDKFASIAVADGQYIIAFSFVHGKNTEEIYQGLNILRHAVNAKLKEDQLNKLLSEAKQIQESILPQKSPVLSGYDIYGVSHPAEIVGGDYFDYIWVGPSTLGLAIADATGHGLPAALCVRDVYMGLRMGSTREFKISQTIEKLNRIINREKLTSRFVSLFYAELESNGVLIYINAGHNPPMVFLRKKVELLTEGGPVLGPLPDRHYNRGVFQMEPGNILLMYTDGLVEARNAAEEEFGTSRIIEIVRRHSRAPARVIVTQLMQALRQFRGERPMEDDVTMVVVKVLKTGIEPSGQAPPQAG